MTISKTMRATLQWIYDQGGVADFYKNWPTHAALHARGLVTIRFVGPGYQYRATLTPDGIDEARR